ncbi:Protein C25H3.4 [Aphelenchoides avenae]|nr:Protein C25H3.4 [Aphelenchus avenae]
MFKKPFQLKSNTNVRSSDRKKILAKVPYAKDVAPKQFSLARVISHTGTAVNVYVGDKEPFFVEADGDATVYPTLYFTWNNPGRVPVLLVPDNVFAYLENGADLMLPGVFATDDFPLPPIERGAPVAIAILATKQRTVKGPMAVGKALMSSSEMLASGMKGRGVQVHHIYGDHLWEFGSKSMAPQVPLDDFIAACESRRTADAPDMPADEGGSEDIPAGSTAEEAPKAEEPGMGRLQLEEEPAGPSPQDMEELLHRTFLSALRFKRDQLTTFPMDAGQFYASVILKSLPPGQRIDLKKTRFKKFGTYLKQVNENDHGWIVKVVSKKGVDQITEINFDHPDVASAEPLEAAATSKPAGSKSAAKVRVAECFSVTEAVVHFLHPLGYRKGDIIQPNQVRELVVHYATENKLIDGSKLTLDDTLQTMMRHFLPDKFPINDVTQKISSQMTKAFVVTLEDGRRIVRRQKMPEIVMSIEKRAGNKVVTLVNNVTVFGIDVKEFCHRIQTKVATGTTVIAEAPLCEGPQVLVHGNQVNFIGELLLDEIGIQTKFVKGLELGVKDKKKGKR